MAMWSHEYEDGFLDGALDLVQSKPNTDYVDGYKQARKLRRAREIWDKLAQAHEHEAIAADLRAEAARLQAEVKAEQE